MEYVRSLSNSSARIKKLVASFLNFAGIPLPSMEFNASNFIVILPLFWGHFRYLLVKKWKCLMSKRITEVLNLSIFKTWANLRQSNLSDYDSKIGSAKQRDSGLDEKHIISFSWRIQKTPFDTFLTSSFFFYFCSRFQCFIIDFFTTPFHKRIRVDFKGVVSTSSEIMLKRELQYYISGFPGLDFESSIAGLVLSRHINKGLSI